MRKKYFTGHKKLSIISLFYFISFSLIAKDKAEEVNIICFAANNQWVCAPENQQQMASDKADKLIGNQSEQKKSQVVIKSVNFPKFNTIENNLNALLVQEEEKTKDTLNNKTSSTELDQNKLPVKKNSNPYAQLWSHQLIGVSTPTNAINYIKKHHLNKDEILVIKTIRKDKDWWIVLYGLYKDKPTGLENEANLPKNLKDYWLRPLRNLHVNGFIENF